MQGLSRYPGPVWIDEPPERFRSHLADEIGGLEEGLNYGPVREVTAEVEERVEHLLAEVEREAGAALSLGPTDYSAEDLDGMGERLFGAVNAWASLASYVLIAAYAPQSPLPKGLAGWGGKVQAQLQRVVNVLLTPLRLAAGLLGASSWSISISFPWAGVQVGLGWP